MMEVLPPSVISLILPYLDLTSLTQLELSCHLLQQVIRSSGEYIRRFRRLQAGLMVEQEWNSLYCKQQLIKHNNEAKRRQFISDHRVSQNISFPRSAVKTGCLRKGLILLLLLLTKAIKFAPQSSRNKIMLKIFETTSALAFKVFSIFFILFFEGKFKSFELIYYFLYFQ